MKIKLHTLLASLSLILGLTATCQADTLRVASTLNKPLTETILSGYQAISGNSFEVTYVAPDEFLGKINSLYRKKLDCVIGPTQDDFYVADHQRMLLPYTSGQLYAVPPSMHVQKNAWTNIWVDYVSFLSNTKQLDKLGIYPPTTWLELTIPKLKDEIILSEYENNQALYSGLTGIWQMEGESLALRYAHEWNKQKLKFVSSDEDGITNIVKGKKALTILPFTKALELAKKYDFLSATLPQDANRHILTGAAILGNTRQIALAQRFIDYLLSDEFISHMESKDYHYLWHVKQSEDPERKALLNNIRIVIDDLGWSALTRKEIIKRWKKA